MKWFNEKSLNWQRIGDLIAEDPEVLRDGIENHSLHPELFEKLWQLYQINKHTK